MAQRDRLERMSPGERRRLRRRNGLRFKFGITPERYDELLAAQDGVCAICRKAPPADRDLDVDHDHSCCAGPRACGDCVRGLLCPGCNRALGFMRDRPDLLRAAAAYLEKR